MYIQSHDQGILLEPETSWVPPTGPLPVLRGLVVGLDTETRDDGLATDRGPGWAYDAGHICGVSAAWRDGGGVAKIYVPTRHPQTECRSQEEVLSWVDDIFQHNHVVFHNAPYDLGWLSWAGVRWPERFSDTQAADVMLDENWPLYSLDACCARSGVPGKNEASLRNAAAAYGCDPKRDLWRMPARHVGAYAEDDAAATLGLWEVLQPRIVADRMVSAYQTEIDLMQVVYHMRRRGIRVNVDQAEIARGLLLGKRDEHIREVERLCGRRVTMEDLNSPDALGDIFGRVGVQCPLTPKTRKPSVTADWLKNLDQPIGAQVRSARQTNDLANKFIGNYILGFAHRGRIHADIHQLRDEEGGARTFRFAYSAPPLQQTPTRAGEVAKPVRRVFEAEDGEYWAAADFSNQEPRLMIHFAELTRQPGAREIAEHFRTDPKADMHTFVAGLLGWTRKKSKDTTQGLAYGMGREKLARTLGRPVEDAEEILEEYHSKVPWVRGLTESCSNLAQERGWIRLIDGSRGHFPLWVPKRAKSVRPLPREEAELLERNTATAEGRRPRNLERAGLHKAANKLIQGSAAKQVKRAMVTAFREGILPLIQLHDELGASCADERTGGRMAEIMRDAVRLTVPTKVDLEWGRTWGDATHTWEDRDVRD